MTELERQLTAALRKLSAQYETEQRRHTEQVEALQQRVEQQTAQSETLRRRIEQLSGQVTGLDADYKTIAATFVWRQVLLLLNVNYSCRFGRLLVRRRTVRWALLRVLKTQKTKRRERPLGDVHGVR